MYSVKIRLAPTGTMLFFQTLQIAVCQSVIFKASKSLFLLVQMFYFRGMKNILMVLASETFRDIEFLVPKAFFEQAGWTVQTASSKKESVGRFGYKVQNDFLLEEVSADSFNGIYFVGGKGALEYLDNDVAKKLFETFLEQGKPVAAICAAPKNFLKWGLLKGKNATGNNSGQEFQHMAEEYGATPYLLESVVVDGLILTASGPEASEESANKYIELLNNHTFC